jgi:antirestriction protein ArdC
VFNEDQIDGLPFTDELMEQPPVQKMENVDRFISATEADIRIGGNKACYVPSHDFIALPPQHQFTSIEHFYATSLHELVHFSGHETRLKRDLKNRFGTKAYAAEELLAELGAAFLCAHLDIPGELKHSEYISTWIQLLKEDNRAIFTAASKASEAANYLRSFSEEKREKAA